MLRFYYNSIRKHFLSERGYSMSNSVEHFVACVMVKSGISMDRVRILDNDADRIYIAVDGDEESHAIRIWDVTQKDCEYSLYQYTDNGTVTCLEHETHIFPEAVKFN